MLQKLFKLCAFVKGMDGSGPIFPKWLNRKKNLLFKKTVAVFSDDFA